MNYTYVLILSPIRSGSTLLKALLGSADDVAHLQEFNFQRYRHVRDLPALEKPIGVLKRPAWLYEFGYPKLPEGKLKKIVLYRDAYDVVRSAKQLISKHPHLLPFLNRYLVNVYWYRIYMNLLTLKEDSDTMFVSYEGLLERPKEITKALFNFIGSTHSEGVDSYSFPQGGWKWGKDDQSEHIRARIVHRPKHSVNDLALKDLVDSSPKVEKVRREYAKVRCL